MGSNKFKCHLICSSTSDHLEQIYAGFNMLMEEGRIKLIISKDDLFYPGYKTAPYLKAVINDSIKVVYDTFDGDSINDKFLDWSRFYFKRSYLKGQHDKKVKPLGLYYSVYPPKDYLQIKKLFWNLRHGINKDYLLPFLRSTTLFTKISSASIGKYTSRVDKFEDFPEIKSDVGVIFSARLWDPKNRSDDSDRTEMNLLRAQTIRLLKKTFGAQFYGGVYPNSYSIKNFPDIVLSEKQISKQQYLRELKKASICVTSRGLHGSNGGKLAEYVAGAKAIVSEPLRYEVPGDFAPEKNYLEFSTPEECVDKVQILIDKPEFRYSMMKSNYSYYHAYLRPDILVWNTIQLALLES